MSSTYSEFLRHMARLVEKYAGDRPCYLCYVAMGMDTYPEREVRAELIEIYGRRATDKYFEALVYRVREVERLYGSFIAEIRRHYRVDDDNKARASWLRDEADK